MAAVLLTVLHLGPSPKRFPAHLTTPPTTGDFPTIPPTRDTEDDLRNGRSSEEPRRRATYEHASKVPERAAKTESDAADLFEL
jgi:hypothetical protein